MGKIGTLKGIQGIQGIQGAAGPGFSQGVWASRPSAATAGAGACYHATDMKVSYLSDGSSWSAISPENNLAKSTDVTTAIPGTSLTAVVVIGPFPPSLMVSGTVIEIESLGLLTCTSSGTLTIDIGKTGNSSGARLVPAPGTKSSVPYRLTAMAIITASATVFTLELAIASTTTSTLYDAVQSTTLASVPWATNDTITLQTQNSAAGVILTPSINIARIMSVGA